MALAYLHEEGDLKGGETRDRPSCEAWGIAALHAVRGPRSTWREPMGKGAQGEELPAAVVGLGVAGRSQRKVYFLICRLGGSAASYRSSDACLWTEVLKVLKGWLASEREAGCAFSVFWAMRQSCEQAVLWKSKQGPGLGEEVRYTCGLLKGITMQSQGGFGWPPERNISRIRVPDLFTGASDTSSSTVEWALADLINNPQAMHKLQEELDSIVGKDRLVTENDIENLPYLGLVLKESMRLHPVVPLLLPYESIKECSIGPYKIPAKTRAYVNTWAIGRDPLVWEMPLDFWPERFDCRNLGAQGQSFELLPFGAGRRRCPGSALAILNIHLLLATLVQGFSWSLASPSSPSFGSNAQFLDMSEKFGTTISMENCLCAFATPRLDLHIY
ncbi:hypothetical protein L7F22_060578 [Adiantum nelumboides]|nr:hypothetical protein [Adiantum nelumboides]